MDNEGLARELGSISAKLERLRNECCDDKENKKKVTEAIDSIKNLEERIEYLEKSEVRNSSVVLFFETIGNFFIVIGLSKLGEYIKNIF